MSICPYCGHKNDDGTQTCKVCGTALSVQPVRTGKKRKKKKMGPGSVILAILAVCVLAGAAFGVIRALSPAAKLNRAVHKTWKSMVVTVKEQDDLKYFADNIERITKSKKASLFIERKTGSDSVSLQLDYNQPKKASRGTVSFRAGGESGELLFASNKKIMQAQLPDITSEVYGFSLKKNDSATAIQFVKNALGVDAGLLFSKDLDKSLDGYLTGIRETWKDFMELAEVEALAKQGDMNVYRVTWSAKDMLTLISGKKANVLGKKLLDVLEKVDGGCTCYVDKQGYVSKIEAVVGADIYTVNFSEGENPWSEFTVGSSRGGATLIRGGVTSTNTEFHIYLGADQGDPLFDLNYTKSNGAIALNFGKISLDGFLHSTKETSSLQFVDSNGSVTRIEFGKLASTPKLLEKKYTDISKMSLGDMSSLAIKTAANSDKIANGWKAISGLLQSLSAD